MMPVIAYNLLQSIELLANGRACSPSAASTASTANRERCEELVEQILAMVTALAPRIGYDAAAAIAKESVAHRQDRAPALRGEEGAAARRAGDALDARAQTYGGLVGGGGGG